jgi:hypothetical protein
MIKLLSEFRYERKQLHILRLQDNNEQENTLKLIKNEVIQVADRVDDMQEMIKEIRQEQKDMMKFIEKVAAYES